MRVDESALEVAYGLFEAVFEVPVARRLTMQTINSFAHTDTVSTLENVLHNIGVFECV